MRRQVSSEMMAISLRKRPVSIAAESPLRFGFSISKKVAKRAHDRNRLKRRLSEIARLEIAPFYSGDSRYDVVVVPRSASVMAEFADLRRDFLALAVRASLLARPAE